MVMSVLISKEGKVCVAHDSYYEGNPVSLHYAPQQKSLTLVMDNGRRALLGSATLPAISRQLERSQNVVVMQIRRPDPAQQFEIPVYVQAAD
jgi:hypothetical protein